MTITQQENNDDAINIGNISKIFSSPFVTRLLIVILALVIVIVSISGIKISEMGTGELYVESILPLPYWIGIAIITITAFFTLKFLNLKRYNYLLLAISIILIIAYRLAFPLMFNSIPAYEPDASNYMTVVSSWVTSGIDFGASGNYQHDYPLAYLVAFVFLKLGVPIDTFFRFAPFVIYGINLLLLFLIVKELFNEEKFATVSAFLLSISSLGYWISVHYCPDLLGSVFFFLSLLLSIKFTKKGLSIKYAIPVLISILLLVLSHHLSTLYFLLTILGLGISTWFFNPPQIKGKYLPFLLLGVFTYTFWFAYGTLVYPEFFNVYIYFSGDFSTPTQLAQQAGLLNNITFAIYPAFLIILTFLELFRIFQIKKPQDILKLREKLKEVRIKESTNIPLVFIFGFVLVLLLFFLGFGAGVSFPTRVLEVLCIGFYPLSSLTLLRFTEKETSKKKLLIILIILLLVVLTGIHRYYSQIQRRIIAV